MEVGGGLDGGVEGAKLRRPRRRRWWRVWRYTTYSFVLDTIYTDKIIRGYGIGRFIICSALINFGMTWSLLC